MRRFFWRLATLFRARGAERDLAREIDAHLALLQEDFERRGMSPADAALAARRAYGGVEQAKELHRAERSFLWLSQTLQDLRYACRGLRGSPGFTLLAVAALALGIGVNTTLFNTYNAIALKPLPVSDPDHVVRFERWVESRSLGNFQYGFSYPEYVYSRDHNQSFSTLTAASWVVLPESQEKRMPGQLVSANYFTALGIQPLLGRGFSLDEDQTPGGNSIVVISYRFWKRQFSGTPQVLGQVIQLNGVAFTIVGVTPEEFTGTPEAPTEIDFWAPLSMQAQLVPGQEWLSHPDQKLFQIFARLKPSENRQAAQAQTDLLIRQFGATYTEKDKTSAVTLQRTTYFPNTDDIRFRALVAALMLIVGLVLFVACANVGNMLLARGAARQREISTRLALGAGRGRVVQQLLAESVLLSCLGGLAGLLTSIWTTKLLWIALQQNAMAVGGDLSVINMTPDFRVMIYVMAISLGSGILFGLSPALQSTNRDIAASLKEGAALERAGGSRLRSFLVASQVAASMLLLAIAGLLARGLIRSQAVEPEFHTRDVFVVIGDFGDSGNSPAQIMARQKHLVEKLNGQPEFAGVALGHRPFSHWTPPIIAGQMRGRTLASYASETYFETLGIPLLRGRNFTPQEASESNHVAVISESTARDFFPGEDPLGKSFKLDMNFLGKLFDFEVIGVVKDVRFANLSRVDPSHVYLPAGLSDSPGSLDVLLRVSGGIQGDSQRALAAVRAATAASIPDRIQSLRLISLDEGAVQIQRTISRTFAMLAGVLAALAVTLAGIGIYGVVAFLVKQRTREIGIRITLGASSRDVWKNVVLQGMRPIFIGMILGLVAAGGLSALLHQTLIFPGSMDFLYGVPFYDPPTFVGIFSFVLGVAILASALPARRALRVDPAVVLRYE